MIYTYLMYYLNTLHLFIFFSRKTLGERWPSGQAMARMDQRSAVWIRASPTDVCSGFRCVLSLAKISSMLRSKLRRSVLGSFLRSKSQTVANSPLFSVFCNIFFPIITFMWWHHYSWLIQIQDILKVLLSFSCLQNEKCI